MLSIQLTDAQHRGGPRLRPERGTHLAALLRGWEPRRVAGQPRSGRPPTDPLARQIVDAQASQSPRLAGLVHSGWTVALLAVFLVTHFCLALSPATVSRY